MKRAYLKKSDRGNRMHLIIPNATSHCGYKNLLDGDQQIVRFQEHKFKSGCNMDNREENVTSVFPSGFREIFI